MFTPLIASFLPFLLFPLELLFPFPYIIEELAKGGLSWFIARDNKGQIKIVIASAFMFSFTENIFYLFKMFQLNDPTLLPKRFLLVTPLHTITMLLMYFGAKSGRITFLISLVVSMLIHYIFNSIK